MLQRLGGARFLLAVVMLSELSHPRRYSLAPLCFAATVSNSGRRKVLRHFAAGLMILSGRILRCASFATPSAKKCVCILKKRVHVIEKCPHVIKKRAHISKEAVGKAKDKGKPVCIGRGDCSLDCILCVNSKNENRNVNICYAPIL